MMANPLVIIFITCGNRRSRTPYALRTIDSVFANLITPYGISWYIADDGSPAPHHNQIREYIKGHGGHICGHHNQKLGYGGSVNKAWPIASQTGPITLWLEDDWELEEPWDMFPYIDLLTKEKDIGMVRLGHLPLGLRGDSESIQRGMYLNLDLSFPYSFSGNPHLKHDRFMLHYGPYPTGKHPGETELGYDEKVKSTPGDGPRIIWPLSIGDRHLWGHIGTHPSYNKGQ